MMNQKNNSIRMTAILAFGFLSACDNDVNKIIEDAIPQTQSAVIATAAADFSSGAHAVFATTTPFDGVTQQSPGDSDLTVNCFNDSIYRTERFTGENVIKFNITNPSEAIYQYSTKDSSGVETASSNPQGLIFVNEEKAYLLRYGSDKAWIVNPSAATEDAFKIGELDLSAYNLGGLPRMGSAVVDQGKLYIALQRLSAAFEPQQAYVAVFDTTTDTEIDTNPAADGLKGIASPVANPQDIEAANGLIYVQGVGKFAGFDGTPPEYTGGIATIDPANNFATALLVDDGDADNHPVGQISAMEIVSASKGYLVGYTNFNDNTLYSFNPSSGEIDQDASGNPAVVAGISATSIRALATDSLSKLWVSIADATDPGVKILLANGEVAAEKVATTLNPGAITFCDAP